MDPDDPDLTPEDAMAVDATPDQTRLHGEPDETEAVERSDDGHVPVDPPD